MTQDTIVSGLLEACNEAAEDFAQDWNSAIDTGERPDLWDPPTVEVSLSDLRAILSAYNEAKAALAPFAATAPLIDNPTDAWDDDTLAFQERSHMPGEVARLTIGQFRTAYRAAVTLEAVG